jgi:opacity protein-like surface antigen
MRISSAFIELVVLIGLACAASASAAPRAAIAPANPVYRIETHVLGSGGYATSDDDTYVLDSTIGDWSVGMVKSSSSVGYAIDGGFWPYVTMADCSGATPTWNADLSVCH